MAGFGKGDHPHPPAQEKIKASQCGSLAGIFTFLFGLLAAGSSAMIGIDSFTAFNPPYAFRIATMAPLPLALIAAAAFGDAGMSRRSGRGWAVAGLLLAWLAVAAFIGFIIAGS